MSAHHTPGPWRAVVAAKGRRRAFGLYGNDNGVTAQRIGSIDDTNEADANARLIAAAPDLLACLKEAVESFAPMDIGEPGEGDPIASWKAAIAKAEGRP